MPLPEHIEQALQRLRERGVDAASAQLRVLDMMANGYDPQQLVVTPRGNVILDPMKVESQARGDRR